MANPYNGATCIRAVHELIDDINDDDRGNYSGQSTVKEEGWPSSPMRNGLLNDRSLGNLMDSLASLTSLATAPATCRLGLLRGGATV